MRRYLVLIYVLVLLFASYAILQPLADEMMLHAEAEDTFSTTDISEDVSTLENSAMNLKVAAESTLDEMQSLELWTNSNANLSGGNRAEILSRLDAAETKAEDYESQLDAIDQKLTVIFDRLSNRKQSDPDAAALMNRAQNVKNTISQIRETLNDISSVRGRIDFSKL